MANKKNHIANSQDYQRYLENRMSARERYDFEKQLLEDDFENEAFEGFSQLQAHEISSDLDDLQKNLNARTHRRNLNVYWRIAAAILLLATFSFSIYFLIDSDSTSEIAQHKTVPVKEEADLDESVATNEDNIVDEQETVIAYQQEVEKEEEKPTAKSIQPPATKMEVPSESDGILDEELEDEINEQPVQLKEVAPMELPDLAYEEKAEVNEVPIEEALTGRVAGVTAKSARASRKRSTNIENTRTITGKVRSEEDDEALPGVNIVVKGSGNGSVSDLEGNYSIEVPDEEEVTLVYSYIGYTSEEVNVGEQQEIDINIEPDGTSLSEIEVIGYASQKKQDVTGAVSSVRLENEKDTRYDPPRPVGGNGNFKDYVRENMRYPVSGLDDKIKGTVKLKFVIETNGSISNLEVLKSLGEDFDREAIRLLNEGPKWEPAKENDVTVVKVVTIKIRFRPPG